MGGNVMAKSAKKWSAEVTAHDHPFDIAPGLFANSSAQQIAAALKISAEDPARGSGDPYRTAMSMLDFYQSRRRQALNRGAEQARSGAGRGQASLGALERRKDHRARCGGGSGVAIGRAEDVALRRQHHLVEVLGEHRRGEEGDGAQRLLAGPG
jgi:hypothetical protein